MLTANVCLSVAKNGPGLPSVAPRPIAGVSIERAQGAEGGYRVISTDAPQTPLAEGDLAACELRRLEVLQERVGEGNFNVEFPTLGGKQLWADVFVHCGWHIQVHHKTGHHRLLDPNDGRLAWGSYDECRVAFERERLARGLAPKSRHAVVLVHGWIRSKDSFDTMARSLEEAGFEVVPFGYPTTRGTLDAHADRLEQVLDGLSGIERVSFVTHSLGGPVVRTLLARPAPSAKSQGDDWRQRIEVGRLVMLFPPSQGSYLAEYWGDFRLFRTIGGEVGQELLPSRAHEIPLPTCPFAIIAGGRGDGEGRNGRIPGDDDGTVAVSEARLPGADAFRVLDVGHTFGMSDPQVMDLTVGYLETGTMR